MRKLLVLALVVVGGWWIFSEGLPMLQDQTSAEEARRRVDSMFGAWERNDEQTAMWMWAEGRRLDLDATSAYVDRFDEFRRRLGMEPGSQWDVVGAAADGRWVRVTVRSELTGERVLLVRSDHSIELVDE